MRCKRNRRKSQLGFVEFCQKFLKLELTEYQLKAAELLDKYDDVALHWCRQSGKTHLIAAWLLHYALTHSASHIAVVGPSWRQTMIPNIRFARNGEVKSGLIPMWAHYPNDIIIVLFDDYVALLSGHGGDVVKGIIGAIKHETMHLILHEFVGEDVADKYDNIAIDVDSSTY